MFIIRIYGYDGTTMTPTNLFVTEPTFYSKVTAAAIVDDGTGTDYLVDTLADGVDDGILLIEGDSAFFRTRSKDARLPVSVYSAAVPSFNQNKSYNEQDVVAFNGLVYFRKTAGSGFWNENDWTVIKSGHMLDTLTYYRDPRFKGQSYNLEKGVFAYSEKYQFSMTPFRPGQESEVTFIRDMNDDKFDFFYQGFVLHAGSVFHKGL